MEWYRTILFIICGKITILNNIDLKNFSNHPCQGHNLHQVTGFVHTFLLYLFFSLINFFLFLQVKGGNKYTKIILHNYYAIKNIGDHAHSRAKDHGTSFVLIKKHVFGMHALICQFMWVLCAVQDVQCNTKESP